MARKLVGLEEAAKMLGVSAETLSEMRERQKVHGYRDGASWKFKPEDIDKLIADREAAEQEGEFAEVDEDPDSILLSEVELGQSNESTSSTIIGGAASKLSPSESDIQLAAPKHDSDLDLDSALTPGPGGSDVLGGSDVVPASGSGVSPRFDELDTLDLDLPSAADSGISSKILSDITAPPAEGSKAAADTGSASGLKAGGSGLAFGSEDELALGEASPEEAQGAIEEEQLLPSAEGGSAIELAGDDDDGDLVLGGGSGDLSRTGDSGISLMNPADSGLSLESAPLELGGSAVDSLELGDDDMLLTEEEAEAGGGAETGAVAAEEQSDDDFLLTPLEEAGAEESDSGSQVIALDEDVEFEEAGADTGALEAGAGLLEEDLGAGLGGALEPAAAPALAAAGAPAAATAAAAAEPEAPFTGWNVVSLALCSVFLLFVGMSMFDLLRNMWSWGGPYSVNSSLMDMILSWFE
jgi:excisionase family DNA binding protein